MKKRIIVIIALVVLFIGVVVCFINYNNKPTFNEINQLQIFYNNYKVCVDQFPTDIDTLENMYTVSKYVFDTDIFFKAFDDTEYYDVYQKLKNNSYYVIKPKKYFQNQLYDEAIIYHLKLLLSLDYYEEYSSFFLRYYKYFADSIEVEFCDCLFIDDAFELSKQDVTTIVKVYDIALSYCDNDIDKFVVLQDLCDFLEKCEKQETTCEMYTEQINDLLDEYGRERFVKDYSKWKGFTSERLC